jgi:hypothetical protein
VIVGGPGIMTPLVADAMSDSPPGAVAATSTRKVAPSSAAVAVYRAAASPPIGEPTAPKHRSHWNERAPVAKSNNPPVTTTSLPTLGWLIADHVPFHAVVVQPLHGWSVRSALPAAFGWMISLNDPGR